MKILKLGEKNNDVKKWQYFLTGQGLYQGLIDGDFGEGTFKASVQFQKLHNLQPDGVVGNKTIGTAMVLGFGVIVDTNTDITSENFPEKPSFEPLVTNSDREKVFGKFSFVHAPTSDSAEQIKVTDNWAKENIIKIEIPQLIALKGTPTVFFHKKAQKQLIQLWDDWEKAHLLHKVLTWDGAYNPRFIRGSRTVLSNHAFGSAFDINVAWNQLGAIPALVGQKGCVRELVHIANDNGFYWGGHFSRKDGMHFEVAKIN